MSRVSAATLRIQERGVATVGIVGTGEISGVYFDAVAASPRTELKACSARSVESATPMAERYAASAVPLEDLLADPEIDLVVNLTGLPQHFAINKAALQAGKHVYSEKPLAGTSAEARELLDLAAERGLRVGCAPDTLLGGGHQAAKAVLDEGRIGTPVTAAAFLGLKAVEQFVPDPAAYFSWDAVVLDIGPYYVSQLVMMLGPVAEVTARGIVGREGRDYPVQVPTTVVGDPRLRVRRPGHAHPQPRRVAAQPPAARDLRDARHADAARPQLLRRRAEVLHRQGPVGARAARRPAVERAQLRAAVRHLRQLPRRRDRGPGRGHHRGPAAPSEWGARSARARGARADPGLSEEQDIEHDPDGPVDGRVGLADGHRRAARLPPGVPPAGEVEVDRPVRRATLHATAHGIYELELDGARVTADELTPGFTEYASRTQVQTYDVTDLLGAGPHTLGALLADGWYRGQVGITRATDQWGTETAFLAQLELEHEDGTTTVLGTDDTWQWSATHILAADLIEGQREDRRLVGVQAWQPVSVSERGYDALVTSPAPPVRAVEELRPVVGDRDPSGRARRRPRAEHQRPGAAHHARTCGHRDHADPRRGARPRRRRDHGRTSSPRCRSCPSR